ncbi:hypothetical protein TrVE_jg6037 [Triparma verrucosa]|uniref:UBC core domain-containing protein n=2 Tax=Triparma TaxID=722752 RepID=A0A9W7E743_9STRA|nr:hypothetical protein TrST_g4192 [Triparma strigata]GMI14894.1 hypothetical protein TrVE_jg6037 [Triparma verrucosa]
MQTTTTGEIVIVPRNFKLLDELESSEKASGNDMTLSYGLVDPEDTFLTNWQANIIGPQNTPFDNRFYSILVTCTDEYPSQPPLIKFVTKINLPCVNQRDGKIIENKLPATKNWNRQMGIYDVLVGIKQQMSMPANRKLPQPGEDDQFS